MNVENLRRTYPLLIDYLRENGYAKVYINEFLTDIKQVLRGASDPRINSYEEYYKSLNTKFTKSTLHHKFKIIGKIKQFDLKGIFPTSIHRCSFLKQDNYECLSPEYKNVIDVFVKSATNRGLSESYIRHLKLAGAKFFDYQQIHGSYSLLDVSERTVQNYFYDGEKIVRGFDVMKQIKNLLKEFIPHYHNGECERIISFLPIMKKSHKTYPFLEEEELEKIKSVLFSDNCTNLTLRDKAIVTIAFYTGLRGCDIAALTFDNIDWEHNIIHLIQNKTGAPLTLPLRPVVGNAIFDYVEKERPDSDNETIFLTRDKKTRKLSTTSIYNATIAVLTKPISQRSRIYPIISFLQYAYQRKWINLKVPKVPHAKPNTHIPHAFSEKELKNFFKACDEIKNGVPIQVKLRKIEVPVFFRLLYSTGLRTTEARLLRKKDVNLQNGVINVCYTKGYNEHRIVLHDTMRELLIRYDKAISKLMPSVELI